MPRKKKPDDKIRKKKQQKAFVITQVEKRHNCRLGTTIKLNGEEFLIALTNYLFVFLIDGKGNSKKLSWSQWDKLAPKLEANHVLWNKQVLETIKFLRKKIHFEWKVKKRREVIREPKVKRFPAKKIKRYPVTKRRK